MTGTGILNREKSATRRKSNSPASSTGSTHASNHHAENGAIMEAPQCNAQPAHTSGYLRQALLRAASAAECRRMKRVKVAQFGLGPIGLAALRLAAEQP